MALSTQLYVRGARRPMWHVFAAALLGLGAGLALTSWSMDREAEARSSAANEALALNDDPPPGHSETGAAPAGATADESASAPIDEGAEGAGSSDEPSDDAPDAEGDEADVNAADVRDEAPEPAEAEPGDGSPVDATPSVPAAPARPTGPPDRRFSRGRLAYLRCGTLEANGRCPRDRDLESAAWDALGVSAHCSLPAGSGDLRLHFSGGAPEVRFRDFGDAPIDSDALHACLAPHMAPLRTAMDHSFVLSIRFSLE